VTAIGVHPPPPYNDRQLLGQGRGAAEATGLALQGGGPLAATRPVDFSRLAAVESRRSATSVMLLFPPTVRRKQTMTPAESRQTAFREPWNMGKLLGQKPPLKLAEIWTVRTQLRTAGKTRDLALFNLAIDSKLRGCDLVALRVRDVVHGDHVLARASVVQHKTGEPVRFELTEHTREALGNWIAEAALDSRDYLFPSRQSGSPHLSTRQYARIVKRWIALMGGDPRDYGTHSLRRTKATLIYRQTENLRAVQLLLGHRKLKSTARYLGIEVDDALAMAEATEC
jgi:integrase